MDGITEKVGIYDIFGVIVPGIIITTAFIFLMPGIFYNDIKAIFTESYEIIFGALVFSYFCGAVLHEVGVIIDDSCGKMLGKPKDTFLMKKDPYNVIENPIDRIAFENLSDNIMESFGKKSKTFDELDKTKFLFSYCINYSEIHGMNKKSEKFQSLSEMSMSLFLGFFICAVVYLGWGLTGSILMDEIYWIKMSVLIISMLVFIERKVRYLRYRIRSLVRTCYILVERDK